MVAPAQRKAKQQHDDTQSLRTYATTWLPERTAVRGLKPKTVSEYQRYLDRLIYPTLGELRLKDVTPARIRAWVGGLNQKTPRLTEHAYALLVAAMPERLLLMIELAAWCALRFGEVAELRRGDIDLKNGAIRVSRAVQWVDGQKIVAAPKADSVRVVAFPPHIGEAIREHLKKHAQWGKDGLLFPTAHGEQYRAPTFHQAYFRKAREDAGRPNLRFHDLRHTPGRPWRPPLVPHLPS